MLNSGASLDSMFHALADPSRRAMVDRLCRGPASVSELAASLARRGLIDEYRVFVAPVVLGGGRPLFQGLGERLSLERVKVETHRSGNVLLSYQSVRR